MTEMCFSVVPYCKTASHHTPTLFRITEWVKEGSWAKNSSNANRKLTSGKRQSEPWAGRQPRTGLTQTDEQPFTLTLTPTDNLQ